MLHSKTEKMKDTLHAIFKSTIKVILGVSILLVFNSCEKEEKPNIREIPSIPRGSIYHPVMKMDSLEIDKNLSLANVYRMGLDQQEHVFGFVERGEASEQDLSPRLQAIYKEWKKRKKWDMQTGDVEIELAGILSIRLNENIQLFSSESFIKDYSDMSFIEGVYLIEEKEKRWKAKLMIRRNGHVKEHTLENQTDEEMLNFLKERQKARSLEARLFGKKESYDDITAKNFVWLQPPKVDREEKKMSWALGKIFGDDYDPTYVEGGYVALGNEHTVMMAVETFSPEQYIYNIPTMEALFNTIKFKSPYRYEDFDNTQKLSRYKLVNFIVGPSKTGNEIALDGYFKREKEKQKALENEFWTQMYLYIGILLLFLILVLFQFLSARNK